MHTKREKHNKKLRSYRLTCTSQNLLLLLRQILKGRRKKKRRRGDRCPTSTALHWELGFFVSCLSLSSFFFFFRPTCSEMQMATTLISSFESQRRLTGRESPRLKAGWCFAGQLPLTTKTLLAAGRQRRARRWLYL